MGKKLLVINTEDVADVVSVLESRALAFGTCSIHKGCINLLDDLYYILDPKRWNKLNQSCALGTCASPEWTCYKCPFANRRPFSESLQRRAKSTYRREHEALMYWRRFIKGRL